MNNRNIWFAIIGLSIVLVGGMMIPRAGPSDQLVEFDLQEEMLKSSAGIFSIKAKILGRETIADDLVDIDVMLTMKRTDQEVPAELYARALMDKRVSGNSFMVTALKSPPGFEFPPEKKTFRYKRVGDQWQKTQ